MTLEKFETEIPEIRKKAENYIISKYKLNYFDTQDILQNACLKAYKNLHSFKEKSSFDTWYISIAKNEALSFLAKKKKSKEIDGSDDFFKNYNLSWIEPKIYDDDEVQEIKDMLNKSISSLSKKHQQVLNLMLKNSLSHKEISKKLKIPVNSVRTRFFYAKKTLKKIILSYALNPRT